MWQKNLKYAFLHLRKNKGFSALNIFGLALGMASCFLAVLYCWHEFTYDTFHSEAEHIYRIEYSMDGPSGEKRGRIPPAVGPALQAYFPEIDAVSRFYPRDLSVAVVEQQRQQEVEHVYFVDTGVTEVFTFDFIHGNPNTAFLDPKGVVLTDKLAQQLFGKVEVLGNSLRLAGEDGFSVSGVIKEWPDQTHLPINMLLPFETMITVEPEHARERTKGFTQYNWSATHSYTYIKLNPQQSPAEVNQRLVSFVKENGDERLKDRQHLSLIPIQDIHLYADRGGPKPLGNENYLYLFLIAGLLTLGIAAINFVNLSTADAMRRAKEVGMRKVLGARRASLILQFLGESTLLSAIAFIAALGLTSLTLPYLNQITGSQIPSTVIFSPLLLLAFGGLALSAGLLAGIYPAFFLSQFQAIAILKGSLTSRERPWNTWMRKGLITVQFLVAIVFITAAGTVFMQLQHLRDQPLGFQQDLVLSVPLNSQNNLNALLRPGDPQIRQRMNTLDERLLNHPQITAVTQCSALPGLGTTARTLATDEIPPEEHLTAPILAVDYDFSEAFDLDIIAGRDFDASFGVDHVSSFLINEQMLRLLSWASPEDAIGKKLIVGRKEGMVIGVVRDFHLESLHHNIQPMAMEVNPGSFGYFAMKVTGQSLPETLSFLEQEWKAAFPEKVFEYSFLNEELDQAYQVERKLGKVIGYAAFLAICIALFGLLGLAARLTQRRFKEIGIRKVLGASAQQILGLIAKDFIQLVLLAILVALPLSWYGLQNWLADFPFRIQFPWWLALLSGLLVAGIAFLTISTQSLRAALSNPVEAIRDE
ncbi:MAG: ABC transporter permease [Saprospiraceae bacterium]|nr:ABC transporter permease [Saprospiraceae bacterium]